MNLIIRSCKNFILANGVLRSIENDTFFIKGLGENVEILDDDNMGTTRNQSSFCNSGVSINNNVVSINGFRIKVVGSSVHIDGKATSVLLNGSELLDKSNNGTFETKKKSENEFRELRVDKNSINSISVAASGSIIINDIECLNKADLMLAIKGSGDIAIRDFKFQLSSLNLSVMGSGDLEVWGADSKNVNASVMGSGDILMEDCSFDTVQLSVMGSGDITGKKTSSKNVSKSIMGSGNINGF